MTKKLNKKDPKQSIDHKKKKKKKKKTSKKEKKNKHRHDAEKKKKRRRVSRTSSSETNSSSDEEDPKDRPLKKKRSREFISCSATEGPSEPNFEVRSSSSSSSSSFKSRSGYDEGLILLDDQEATTLLKQMLTQSPALTSELLEIIKIVDEGQSIMLQDIQDQQIKSQLHQLFIALALIQKKGCFLKPPHLSYTLLDKVEELLSTPSQDVQESKAPPPAIRKIGPMLPGTSTMNVQEVREEESEEDDFVGPMLPGMAGYRAPDVDTLAQMEAEEKEAWNRLHQRPGPSDEPPSQKREEWMTLMPDDSKMLSDVLGPSTKAMMKGRQFSKREKQAIDPTWNATPEQRQQAERERAEIDLLGYSRSASSKSKPQEKLPTVGAATIKTTSESIMPSMNPEADAQLRYSMKKIRELRGTSLAQQHHEKLKRQKQKEIQNPTSTNTLARGWDRERDLVGRRNTNQAQLDEMMKNANQMSSRFAAPQTSRQFL